MWKLQKFLGPGHSKNVNKWPNLHFSPRHLKFCCTLYGVLRVPREIKNTDFLVHKKERWIKLRERSSYLTLIYTQILLTRLIWCRHILFEQKVGDRKTFTKTKPVKTKNLTFFCFFLTTTARRYMELFYCLSVHRIFSGFPICALQPISSTAHRSRRSRGHLDRKYRKDKKTWQIKCKWVLQNQTSARDIFNLSENYHRRGPKFWKIVVGKCPVKSKTATITNSNTTKDWMATYKFPQTGQRWVTQWLAH